jgi:2-oxo-4-hydroxy-4-carboxy-5-ureidoimidazoline decarboxylase
VTLDELNALDAPAAARELRRCCGSRRWVDRMTAARPFDSAEAMAATADAVWWSLDRADWLEAFAAHPRIGEIGSGGSRGSGGSGGLSGSHESGWAAREQAGVASAPASVRERLAAANREYDARFGYIFIVCATGKSADEMLAMLEQRLTNDPEAELRIAAEEQRKITQLRLSKLLT